MPPFIRISLDSCRKLSILAIAGMLLVLDASAWATPAATTTKIAMTSGGSSVVTIAAGKTVTLTATVTSGGSPVTTGQVSFCDAKAKYCTGTHLIGLAQLTAIGKATLSLRPAAGSHSYKAVFAPTVNDAGSSSGSTTLVVTQSGAYPTAITIAQSGSPGAQTVTATVNGSGPAAPTGMVSFLDASNGNALLGTAALTAPPGEVGLMGPPISLGTDGGGSLTAVGDFNGDGIPDLAVATLTGPLEIQLGKGDGTFALAASYSLKGVHPLVIVVADFNQDGIPDVAVSYASCYADCKGSGADPNLQIMLGNGDGTFALGSSYSPPSAVYRMAEGDFNGDGIPDLITEDDVLFGNGDGTFLASGQSLNFESYPMTVGDFNGDGISDLALANPDFTRCGGGTLTVFLGNPDGIFSSADQCVVIGPYPAALATGDFDGDGILDLVVLQKECYFGNLCTVNGGAILLRGNGGGYFTVDGGVASPIGSDSIAVADFNGDGIPDLVVAAPTDNSVTIFLATANGGWLPNGEFREGPLTVADAHGIVTADFNGDGVPDLAVTSNSGLTVLLVASRVSSGSATAVLPASTGTHQVVASYAGDSNYAAGTSAETGLAAPKSTPTVTVTASASKTTYGTSVTLTAKVAGAGNLPTGVVTFDNGTLGLGSPTLSNGVATYTTSAVAAGMNSITATYGGDTNYNLATSNAINLTVTPGTPKASLSASSNSVLQGTPVTFTVTLTGGGVNPTGIVTWLDGATELSASRVSASGVATYATSTLALGSHSITASYGGDSNYLAVKSPTVAVKVGATLKPTVTVTPASSSITLAQALTVAVAVNGGTGNPAVTGTVTLKGGGYASAAASLAAGGASFTIPAGSLAAGTDTLTAAYTPDAASTSHYTSSSGTAVVKVSAASQVSLSAASLTFPATVSGQTSTLPVTLTNTGIANLTVTGISITGTNAGAFSHTSNCGGHAIAPKGTCTIQVEFAPTASGAFTAVLHIADNAPDSPQTVTLSGTGAAGAPAASLSATSLSFGSDTVGTRSASQTVTLTNTGGTDLWISNIATSGGNAVAPFDFANTCGVSLAPGASCTIHGHFIPSAVGAATESVLIADNAPDSPQQIMLSGTGVGGPSVSSSSYSLSFPTTVPGATSTNYVNLTNSGTENLTVTGFSVSGANPGLFTHTSNCGGHAIAAGSPCTVVITYAPTATDSSSATLYISDNAPDSPQAIVLTAPQAQGPLPVLSSTSIVFAATPVGSYNNSEELLVTNGGTGSLAVSAVALAGANPADFQVSDTQNCPNVPNDGSICYVFPTFIPKAVGPFYAKVKITDNATGSPRYVDVQGLGTNGPTVKLSATSLTFPATPVGSTSTLPVTVTNAYGSPLQIKLISNGGANPTEFGHTSNCGGHEIAPGASCTVDVTFTPQSAGSFTAKMWIYDNAVGSPQTITLNAPQTPSQAPADLKPAEAVPGSADLQLESNAANGPQLPEVSETSPAPAVTLSATSISFGNENVGTQSAGKSVTMTNTGNAALSIGSIAVSGAHASSFDFVNTCGSTLAIGANCIIYGTFTPAAMGLVSATVAITDNAAGSPQTIAVSGTGANVPSVSLSAHVLTFPNTASGGKSTLPVTLENTGNANLTVTGIGNSGANPANFTHTSNCGGHAIAPGAQCTIDITFAPTATGSYSATLNIQDNATDTPQSVTLTAPQTPGPLAAFSATSIQFAPTSVGSYNNSQELMVTNAGTGNLSVTGVTITGTNPGDFMVSTTQNCTKIPNDGSICYIFPVFVPATLGSLTATLKITDNASGSPQYVTVQGLGTTGPGVKLSATSLSFPSTAVGSTSTLPVTLTNSGGAPLQVTSISNGGANPTEFSHTSNCGGHQIAPGAGCTVEVSFTPQTAGSFAATLRIYDNALGSPQTVTLTGTGTAASAITSSAASPGLPAQSMDAPGAGMARAASNGVEW